MESTLPLVFSGGFPRSLYELSEVQLERFLIYVWTFTNTAKHAQVLPEDNGGDRAASLRQLICALYERLGVDYLLYLSEGLAKTKGSNIYYEIDTKKNDVIVWNKRTRSVLARIPASNVCYDAFSGKLLTPVKKTRRKIISKKKVWSEVPIVQIELPDSDTEDPLENNHKKNTEISECRTEENRALTEHRTEESNVLKRNTGERIASSVRRTEKSVVTSECRAEESIIISDSEEPTNVIQQLCTWVPYISDSVSITKLTNTLQPKNGKKSPFINKSLSVSKIIPNQQKIVEKRPNVTRNLAAPILVTVTDDGEIVISDSEDTREQAQPPPKKAPDRLIEEIIISDSEDADDQENKNDFLYRLGLCEPTNLPDDPIILPIPGKGDFNKFHRLPLTMIPLLVNHSLIDKHSVVPGPPGQNSHFTSTNKRHVSESVNKSRRTKEKFGRYRTLDMEKCKVYHYPKKHYRGVRSAPLPLRKRQRTLPCSKTLTLKKKSHPGLLCETSNPVVMVEKLDTHIYLKYLKSQ